MFKARLKAEIFAKDYQRRKMEMDGVVMLCLMKTWLVETLRCLVVFEAVVYFQSADIIFSLFIISYNI